MKEFMNRSDSIKVNGVVYVINECTVGDIMKLQKLFVADSKKVNNVEKIISILKHRIIREDTEVMITDSELEKFPGSAAACLSDIFSELNKELKDMFFSKKKEQ